MTTTVTPRDRIESVARNFTPDATVTYDEQMKFHSTRFDLRRGDRIYHINLSMFAAFPDQNIQTQVHRVDPWKTLCMVSYLNDSLLETVITQAINHDQEQ